MKLAVRGFSISPRLRVFLSGCWASVESSMPPPPKLFVVFTLLLFLSLSFSACFFAASFSFFDAFLFELFSTEAALTKDVVSKKDSFFARKSPINAWGIKVKIFSEGACLTY